jgi:hypothetical protein
VRLRLLALLTATCLVVAGAYATPAIAADETITISGTVLGDDGAGLGGVAVNASVEGDGPASDDFETSTTTDSSGHYVVTVPRSSRSYELNFDKDRWLPRGWSANGKRGKDLTDVNVQLVRYGSIRGAITSPKGSVEDVDVNLVRQQAGENDSVDTGVDGTYRFDRVAPGRYVVQFDGEDFYRTYGPDDGRDVEYVDVEPGQDVVLRTVGPRPTSGTPTGTIVADLTGTRRQYPEVTAISLDQKTARAEQLYLGIGEPMVATLDGLPPGQYKIALGGRTTWYGGLSWASAAPVTVVAGQTTTISAQPGREMWATGRLVTVAGDPVHGLDVELLRSDSPGEVIADLSAESGYFSIEDLPVADYYIRVTDPTGEYASKIFDLPPEPDSDDEYRLEGRTPIGPAYPGPISGSASVTYTGYRSPGDVCFVPTSGRRGDEMMCGEFDWETQQYDVEGIKPGDYKVRGGGDARATVGLTWLGGRTFASATTVTMAPGEHKELAVPGQPDAGTVVGTVVGGRDVPMPSISVLAYAADDPDVIIASAASSYGRWMLESLPARPYKLRLVDPTARYGSTWFGGSSFATATAVTPRLADTMQLADVTLTPRFGALAPPVVSGGGYVGDVLTATPGFWTSRGVAVTYQWLRDGTPVAGADSPTYRLTGADLRHRLSMRVEARTAGGDRATTTSHPTYSVTTRPTPQADAPGTPRPPQTSPRARPTVKTTVKRLGGGKVRLTVRYSGRGATPTGRVSVRRGSTTAMGWRQLRNGRFSITLKRQPRKAVRYTVRYSGSGAFLPDVRQTARVRVR